MKSAIFKDGKGRSASFKDPDATLDYAFDWSQYLTEIGDSVLALGSAVSGVTKVSESVENGVLTVFVSGGAVGSEASITCTISTVGGRIDQRTIFLQLRQM